MIVIVFLGIVDLALLSSLGFALYLAHWANTHPEPLPEPVTWRIPPDPLCSPGRRQPITGWYTDLKKPQADQAINVTAEYAELGRVKKCSPGY